jgi:hypothetical protein
MTKQQKIVSNEDLDGHLQNDWVVVIPYEHAGLQYGYIIEKSFKDNPVPSLDKNDFDFLILELTMLEDKASLNNFGLAHRYRKIKNKLLQNGVETEKN